MIPYLLFPSVDICEVCGERYRERDLLCVETQAESDRLGVPIDGLVCRGCAEAVIGAARRRRAKGRSS